MTARPLHLTLAAALVATTALFSATPTATADELTPDPRGDRIEADPGGVPDDACVAPARADTTAGNGVPGFPVPAWGGQNTRDDLARDLRTAQDSLRAHLRARPADNSNLQAVLDWDAGRNRLLADMIEAEEALVWWAAEPYTAEENATIAPAFEAFDQARRQMRRAAATDEAADGIIRLMDETRQRYNGALGRIAEGGAPGINNPRGQQVHRYLEIAMLRWLYQELSRRLGTVQHEGAGARTEAARVFDRAAEAIGSTLRSRRQRGVAAINQRLSQQAARQNGDDAGPRPAPVFRIHRPVTANEIREVERRLSRRYGVIGEFFPGGQRRDGFFMTEDSTPFDDDRQRLLIGDAAQDRIERLSGRLHCIDSD